MIWLKVLIRAMLVALIAVSATGFWLLHTESGAVWAWQQLESRMDGELSGEMVGGNLADGIEVKNVRLSTPAVELFLESQRAAIHLDLVPLRVQASKILLQNLTLKTLSSESESELELESLLEGLRLPLQLDIVDFQVDGIELSTDEGSAYSIEQVLGSALWQDEIRIREIHARNGDGSIAIAGKIELAQEQSIDLAIEAIYQGVTIQGDLSSNVRTAQLHNVLINGDAIDATASALVEWSGGVRAHGSVQVERFDPASLMAQWPASKSVTGSFNFDASAKAVRLTDSQLAISHSDAAVAFDADFDRLSEQLSADIRWRNMQWPIDSPVPLVKSAEGRLSVEGEFDEWRVDGIVSLATNEMPDGRFEIRGGGDRGQLALIIRDGLVLGGRLAGEAAYSWQGDQAWSTTLMFENLHTAAITPEWPGEVSGTATANGTLEPLAVNVNLEEIDGYIRASQLTANGSLFLSDSILFADKLAISHGDSTILLDGSADTPEGLTFRAGIDIGSYVQNAFGRFDANGRWSREESGPFVSLDLTSSEIQVGDMRASGIRLIDDRTDDAFTSFSLRIDDLAIQGQNASDIQLSALVRQQRQSIELTGINRGSNIRLALDGAFDDWSAAGQSPWRGSVSEFSIDLEDEHSLSLERPAAVELSPTKQALEGFCLADAISMQLCIDGLRASDGRVELRAALANLPLALIEHLLDTDAIFDQHMSGEIVWSGGEGPGATGRGALELSPGVISSRRQPSLAIETATGQLSFEIADGELLSGIASIPMPGIGGLNAQFKVLELSEVANSTVDGHLGLVMTDIGSLALFSHWLDSASGELNADLDLTGTISEPLLTGSATLENGALSYRPIGLNIDHIDLHGELTESRAIELAGNFRIEDGHGEVISSADYRDTERPGLRFKIQGEALQLVNVPNVQLSVDPDIEIAFNGNALDIDGSLFVSKARITPTNLVTSISTESDDIVIVAGQLPEMAISTKEKPNLQFGGSLKVDLGSDVDIVLDIARAKLSGAAVFNWQGDVMPIVDGRYDLSGNVNAFGQVLNIAEGSVRFANVPANRPYLNIRAEREIFGNSQVKRAGILLAGVPGRPTIDAYTYPATNEERALTLLVTGSDFDYEQGVGAIDFGTYIAPRLFVSYGIGIFDRENVVSARYDLSKGFGVKASSGAKQSGVDLNYRIEN